MGPGQELQASTGGRSAALRVAAISGGGRTGGTGEPGGMCCPGQADGAAGAISTGASRMSVPGIRGPGMAWGGVGEGAWGRWV